MPSIDLNNTNTDKDDDDSTHTQKYYDVLAFTMPLILFVVMICYLDVKARILTCNKKSSIKKPEPVKQDKELYIENIKELKLKKSNNEVCPICIQELKKGEKIISLECNHQYHKYCIESWISQNIKLHNKSECPLCRASIKHKYKHNFNKNDQGVIIKITLD